MSEVLLSSRAIAFAFLQSVLPPTLSSRHVFPTFLFVNDVRASCIELCRRLRLCGSTPAGMRDYLAGELGLEVSISSRLYITKKHTVWKNI
jgi:hypothetical protein